MHSQVYSETIASVLMVGTDRCCRNSLLSGALSFVVSGSLFAFNVSAFVGTAAVDTATLHHMGPILSALDPEVCMRSVS